MLLDVERPHKAEFIVGTEAEASAPVPEMVVAANEGSQKGIPVAVLAEESGREAGLPALAHPIGEVAGVE